MATIKHLFSYSASLVCRAASVYAKELVISSACINGVKMFVDKRSYGL